MNIDYKKIAELNNVTEEDVINLEKEFKKFLYNQLIKSVSEGKLVKVQMRGFGTIQVQERTINHKILKFIEIFRQSKTKGEEYDSERVAKFRLLWQYRHEKLKLYHNDNRRNPKRNYLLKMPKK
jgi:hypothetical protein